MTIYTHVYTLHVWRERKGRREGGREGGREKVINRWSKRREGGREGGKKGEGEGEGERGGKEGRTKGKEEGGKQILRIEKRVQAMPRVCTCTCTCSTAIDMYMYMNMYNVTCDSLGDVATPPDQQSGVLSGEGRERPALHEHWHQVIQKYQHLHVWR